MAKHTEKVIILEKPDDHEHWRTFVALLLLTKVAEFGIRAIHTALYFFDKPITWGLGFRIGTDVILGIGLAGRYNRKLWMA